MLEYSLGLCHDRMMDSRLDTEKDQVVISLTNQECLDIAGGRMIGDRNNPFDPMAKIEVALYTELDPTYKPFDPLNTDGDRLTDAFARVACKATILNNNDIRVFVPKELVAYNFFSAETITVERIQADDDVMPAGGIRMEFSSRL